MSGTYFYLDTVDTEIHFPTLTVTMTWDIQLFGKLDSDFDKYE